ncbi:MAG: hypothetical protein K0R39_4155, partial [Symbiobacteriaceae bacterium]|nr:hypothetical protein [Symbiobacteriaceae bacterium]
PWGQGAAAALAGLAAAGALIVGAGDVAAWLAGRAEPAAAARHGALAVALNPWNDLARAQYGLALSGLGRRDEAQAQFAEARRLGPREPWYAELAARELLQAGHTAEALEAYRDFVRLWPWYVPAYESALSAHSDLLFRAEVALDEAAAAHIIGSARAILDQLERQKAKEPPGRPRRPMDVNTPVLQQARATFAP